MLTLFSRWFEQSAASRDYTATEYILLWIMLSVGACLRFWNLDYASLHGDEDIMGLAARGVLEHGIPILPSEMVYTRALMHVYLLAGSMQIFGDSEWSLRLPSAISGSLCGLLAFLAGKRFLDPKPNLMFVALISFLPIMIEISQTGRMYVFLVMGLLLFAVFLFRWEKTASVSSLLLAFSSWFLTLQFHALAVFAAPLFLFPGLTNRSWKQLGQGVLALALALVSFYLSRKFASLDMPSESERLVLPTEVTQSPLCLLLQGYAGFVLGCVVATVILVMGIGTVGTARRAALMPSILLLGLGAVSCSLLHYHIGAIALLLGIIVWLRTGEKKYSRLILLAGVVTLMALTQAYILHATGEFPGRKIIGALIGTPSIWPILIFAGLIPIGSMVYLATLGFAAFRLSQGRAIPTHFLFFIISVWAMLLAIGVFTWYTPPRYTLGALPFFCLCLPAGIWYLLQDTRLGQRLLERRVLLGLTLVIMVAAFVNPIAALDAARNDHRNYADHKGAAQFVKSLNLTPADILIAEDSINQTYYLGKVHYRLLNVEVAKNHSFLDQGVLRGDYTGTPIIGTGRELEALLNRADVGNIYIIGSGDNFEYKNRRNRGNGILEVLQSSRLEVIYTGRDGGKTKVWKFRKPHDTLKRDELAIRHGSFS